jgi:hypothetical protein
MAAALIPLATAPAARAASIRYEAADLADTTPGEDLWLYRYRVEAAVFPAGNGFSVFFDLGLYEQLVAGAAPNADWDVIAIQPDAGLESDGFYDALALVGPASLADLFEVSFVWLGVGTPGSQRFVLYDGNFQTLEQGETALVPEAATGVALALGLVALGALRRAPSRLRPVPRPSAPD